MKILLMDFNLLFFRYVVYDHKNKIVERIFLQWPWTQLKKHIGNYTTL